MPAKEIIEDGLEFTDGGLHCSIRRQEWAGLLHDPGEMDMQFQSGGASILERHPF